MIEIVPSIIAKDNKELNYKIALVKNHCKRVQLDIMDGKFVKGKTILPAHVKLRHKIDIEFHLMVKNPDKYVDDCVKLKPKKIIFHASAKNIKKLIQKIKRHKIKAGIALNPEDRVSKYKEYIKKADFVQLMTVHPGKYGAKFLPFVLRKIFVIKKIKKNIPVEVDGGINEKTACKVIAAHADTMGVGSAIFKVRNSEKALIELKKLVRKCKAAKDYFGALKGIGHFTKEDKFDFHE